MQDKINNDTRVRRDNLCLALSYLCNNWSKCLDNRPRLKIRTVRDWNSSKLSQLFL